MNPETLPSQPIEQEIRTTAPPQETSGASLLKTLLCSAVLLVIGVGAGYMAYDFTKKGNQTQLQPIVTEGANISWESKNTYTDLVNNLSFEYPKTYGLSLDGAQISVHSTSSPLLGVHVYPFATVTFKTTKEACDHAAKEGDTDCVSPDSSQDTFIASKNLIEEAAVGTILTGDNAQGLQGEVVEVSGRKVLLSLSYSSQAGFVYAYARMYKDNGDLIKLEMALEDDTELAAQQSPRWFEFKDVVRTLTVK